LGEGHVAIAYRRTGWGTPHVAGFISKGRATEKYGEATFFANQGVPVFVDGEHQIAHNKAMVIDGATVITGSVNFTRSAEESNAENLLVIRSVENAAKYEKNYQGHLAHSAKYERGGPGG